MISNKRKQCIQNYIKMNPNCLKNLLTMIIKLTLIKYHIYKINKKKKGNPKILLMKYIKLKLYYLPSASYQRMLEINKNQCGRKIKIL